MIPQFETRRDAENYAETLAMQGYEGSFGYDVRVVTARNEDGETAYEVRIQRNGRGRGD